MRMWRAIKSAFWPGSEDISEGCRATVGLQPEIEVSPTVTVAKPKPLPEPPNYDVRRREAIESVRARGLTRPLVTEKRAPRIVEPSHHLERIERLTDEAKKAHKPVRLAGAGGRKS